MPVRAAASPWFSSTTVRTFVMPWGTGWVTTGCGVGLPAVGVLLGLLGLLAGRPALPEEHPATAAAATAATRETRSRGLRMGALCPVPQTGEVDPQHAFSD